MGPEYLIQQLYKSFLDFSLATVILEFSGHRQKEPALGSRSRPPGKWIYRYDLDGIFLLFSALYGGCAAYRKRYPTSFPLDWILCGLLGALVSFVGSPGWLQHRHQLTDAMETVRPRKELARETLDLFLELNATETPFIHPGVVLVHNARVFIKTGDEGDAPELSGRLYLPRVGVRKKNWDLLTRVENPVLHTFEEYRRPVEVFRSTRDELDFFVCLNPPCPETHYFLLLPEAEENLAPPPE